jgi:hypothetical protein
MPKTIKKFKPLFNNVMLNFMNAFGSLVACFFLQNTVKRVEEFLPGAYRLHEKIVCFMIFEMLGGS